MCLDVHRMYVLTKERDLQVVEIEQATLPLPYLILPVVLCWISVFGDSFDLESR